MRIRDRIISIGLAVFICLAGFHIAHVAAQVSTPVGFVPSVNYLAPTAGAQMATVGGITTNPASNFIVQVSPGEVFCNGAATEVPPVQLVLGASQSYLIVYNCAQSQVYARTAVTGPGSPVGQPGVPNTILYATPGVEIAIATVVCNVTACGNGGNGTITDSRVPGLWLAGGVQGGHVFNPSTSGDTDFVITLAGGTATKTFNIPFISTPVCVGTDQTAANAVKIAPTTTNAVFTGTTTDVIAAHCAGNPN